MSTYAVLMVTLSIMLILIGFYLFYFTSKRLRFVGLNKFQEWIGSHERASKSTGYGLFLLALCVAWADMGIGVGSFFFAVSLMALASLEILCLPLYFFEWKYTAPLLILSLILEIIL